MSPIQTSEYIHELTLRECIQCGKCTGGCPVSLKTTLNIRRLIYESLISDTFSPESHDELWDCTTCKTCTLRCPKGVDPCGLIVTLRGALVESGRIPSTVRDALKSITVRGNPLNMPPQDRALWTEGLEVKYILEEEAEVLFFPCCMGAYDPRIQKVARSLVKVFQEAGVDFGILGEDEICCAHEARRLGEKELFEGTVEQYQEIFSEVKAEKLVALSPHCYNAFKNEYGELPFQVLHYTQFLADLIKQGKLKLVREIPKKVTYHDPCYLGKQNKIFDEPRFVLQSIPGLELVEMERCREWSLCCEGGGGRMWAEGTNIEVRLSHERVREALDTGAEILAVACPFCMAMLEDAAKTLGLEEKLKVLDIAELVAMSLG